MAHAEVAARLFAIRGRARKGDALLVIDGDPELELGTVARIAAGDEPMVDGRLVVGRRGEERIDVDADGRVFVAGVHTNDSLGTLVEAHLRRRELMRNTHLFHTPAENLDSFVEALSLEAIDEACDSRARYLVGGVIRARVCGDALTMGVRHTKETKEIIEHAAEHDLPLRYDVPEAVLMVRPPAKAPSTHRKGIEAPAWCREQEHGVVRFYRRGRFMSVSQWLYVDTQVTEILGPGIDMITRERFIGLTDELDDVLSADCVAWLRARGATLDPADASREEDLATLTEQEREWDRRFGGLSVDAEHPLRVGVTSCGGAQARFGDREITGVELPRAIEKWLLSGEVE